MSRALGTKQQLQIRNGKPLLILRANGCLEWTGGHTGKGYPVGSIMGVPRTLHRVALERKLGRPLRPEMFCCHHCDNPGCILPAHLYEGTPSQNYADLVERGDPNNVCGESHRLARLSSGQVREIYARKAAGEHAASLAEAFGVSIRHVYLIATKKKWKHLWKEEP